MAVRRFGRAVQCLLDRQTVTAAILARLLPAGSGSRRGRDGFEVEVVEGGHVIQARLELVPKRLDRRIVELESGELGNTADLFGIDRHWYLPLGRDEKSVPVGGIAGFDGDGGNGSARREQPLGLAHDMYPALVEDGARHFGFDL